MCFGVRLRAPRRRLEVEVEVVAFFVDIWASGFFEHDGQDDVR